MGALLRIVTGGLLAALIAAPAVTSAEGSECSRRPVSAAATPLRAADILREINRIRVGRGLEALRHSPPLARAAVFHSRQMGREGFFSHDSADGSTFEKRVKRFYPTTGYRRWRAGENLLWASGELTAVRAVAMWMKSRGHRANLLAPRWREVGIGVVRWNDAPGVYRGRDVVIVTADFGMRE